MEWIILAIGVLGLGAILGSSVNSTEDNATQELSEDRTGKVVSYSSFQEDRHESHVEEEEMVRLHEETVRRDQIEQHQHMHDEQQRLFQEQADEQQRLFDEQSTLLTEQSHDHLEDATHSFSNPYTDVGTDINTDIHYHGVVDDPLETMDDFEHDSYDDYADEPMETWQDTYFDDHY